MSTEETAPNRLLTFVAACTRLLQPPPADEESLLTQAGALMRTLVATDDWLPAAMAEPHPTYYQQHLLYGDPLDRFSVVSFVWGPGQYTPIHDHTVWGVIGMLRGSECGQRYEQANAEAPGLRAVGHEQQLLPGDIEFVSPRIGDIHRVRNVYADRVSISIHLYGGNIGRIHRHVYDADSGTRKPFVSGYSNLSVPNLWRMQLSEQ